MSDIDLHVVRMGTGRPPLLLVHGFIRLAVHQHATTVDRLLHHAHVVITTGDSIRLTQATRGKGVTPLTN